MSEKQKSAKKKASGTKVAATKKSASKAAKNGRADATASSSPILLPAGYRPTEKEEFMNPLQLLYFRQKLEAWRAELLDEASDTISGLSQENLHQPDQMDREQIESNAALDLRTRDRERKLLCWEAR